MVLNLLFFLIIFMSIERKNRIKTGERPVKYVWLNIHEPTYWKGMLKLKVWFMQMYWMEDENGTAGVM